MLGIYSWFYFYFRVCKDDGELDLEGGFRIGLWNCLRIEKSVGLNINSIDSFGC